MDANHDAITIAKDDDLYGLQLLLKSLRMTISTEEYPFNIKCPIISQRLATYFVRFNLSNISRVVRLIPGHLEFSFEQLQSFTRSIFKLPPSTHSVLTYNSTHRNRSERVITISNSVELKHFLAQERGMNGIVDSSVTIHVVGHVKVEYKNTHRRLTLSPDMLKFSYEQLESCIRDLFELNQVSSHQLRLSYKSDFWEDIIISRSEEVKDILVMLSLRDYPLRLRGVNRE